MPMSKRTSINQKIKAEIVCLLKEYVEGVLNFQSNINRSHKEAQLASLLDSGVVLRMNAFGNGKRINNGLVLKSDAQKLGDATRKLLAGAKLSRRISQNHGLKILQSEIDQELLEGKRKALSYFNVIDRVLVKLLSELEQGFLFLFPVIYTHDTLEFNAEFGPLRIGDLASFRNYHIRLNKIGLDKGRSDFDDSYQAAWDRVEKRAKHLVVVKVYGYQQEMGEVVARRAAEFFLNLLRLSFGWDREKQIKIMNLNMEVTYLPKTVLDFDGKVISKSLSSGQSEYHPIEKGVGIEAIKTLEVYKNFLPNIIGGIVRGASTKSVTLQRIEYASFLIQSAYEQKSVRIALVNFVAALETLACLDGEARKRRQLVDLFSALLSNITDEEREEMRNAIAIAYDARSEVVHGDAHEEQNYAAIFRNLEKWMFSLVLIAMDFLCYLEAKQNPVGNRQLRAAIRDHFREQ